MEISYEARFFMYDMLMIISLIVVGYTLFLKAFPFSVAFSVLAFFMHRRLIKTMQVRYNPDY